MFGFDVHRRPRHTMGIGQEEDEKVQEGGKKQHEK